MNAKTKNLIEGAATKYALDLDPSYQIMTGEDQKASDAFKSGASFGYGQGVDDCIRLLSHWVGFEHPADFVRSLLSDERGA